MDIDLKRFETNLEAARNLQDIIHGKRRVLLLQVWQALHDRLPERAKIRPMTTICQALPGDGGRWDIKIELPELKDQHWRVFKDVYAGPDGIDGFKSGSNELLFQLPCTTPAVEVVEATITRITVDLFARRG